MNRIKSIREAYNLTQTELAARANISQPYLHDLENNRRGAKRETEQRIADALGVTVEELHESKGEETDDDGRETEDSPRNRAV